MNDAQEMELRELLEKYLDHNLITTSVHITIKGNKYVIIDGEKV
jgi:hypothetical protein